MDRDALVARAETRFRDTNNNVYSPAEWADYVNDAYLDVVAADPYWPFLESRDTSLSVTAGTNTVTLPADVWRVTAVYNATDSFPMHPLHGRSEYRTWYPDATQTGSPTFYRLRGNILEVFPTAAATTEIDVDTFDPPATLGAADEPVFPSQYHRLLVSGALAYAYDDDGNLQQGALHRGRFEQGIERMRADLLSPRLETYPTVIDTL